MSTKATSEGWNPGKGLLAGAGGGDLRGTGRPGREPSPDPPPGGGDPPPAPAPFCREWGADLPAGTAVGQPPRLQRGTNCTVAFLIIIN